MSEEKMEEFTGEIAEAEGRAAEETESVGEFVEFVELDVPDTVENADEQEGDDDCEDEELVLEFNEEDILYYIEDEDGNELGFAVLEDGQEVEYYFDDVDVDSPVYYDELEEAEAVAEAAETEAEAGAEEIEEELYEIEVDEDEILYYIEDEDGNELGFAVLEDGEEVEYYYADDDEYEYVEVEEDAATASASAQGAESEAEAGTPAGGKPASGIAGKVGDLGITKEDVKAAADDIGAIAKEGADLIKDLSEAYNDIFGELDFLKKGKGKGIISTTKRR